MPGNGSDLGIRQTWLPLFDKYEVDLVLSGHEHDYERTSSIFDVDPGERPGETTITFQYFAIPAVTNEASSAHDGTTTLPSAPTEKFVFGRRVGER